MRKHKSPLNVSTVRDNRQGCAKQEIHAVLIYRKKKFPVMLEWVWVCVWQICLQVEAVPVFCFSPQWEWELVSLKSFLKALLYTYYNPPEKGWYHFFFSDANTESSSITWYWFSCDVYSLHLKYRGKNEIAKNMTHTKGQIYSINLFQI